jgi:septal ring factor EnvC (AmiA/AmiB activator)
MSPQLRPVDANKVRAVTEWNETVTLIVAEIDTTQVTSPETEAVAADVGRMAKDTLKELEDARTAAVKPLNDEVRTINAAYKPLTSALEAGIDRLKAKIAAYRAAARAAAEAAAKLAQEQRAALEQKAQEAAAAGLPIPPIITEVPQAAPAKRVEGTIGTSSGRETWAFEVEDPAIVPRQYMVVDEKLIRAAVAVGVRAIPGVRIFQKETVVFG